MIFLRTDEEKGVTGMISTIPVTPSVFGIFMLLLYRPSSIPMTNRAMPKEEWEQYKEKHIGFCKDMIWYYEKEAHLVVELIDEANM